MCFSDQIMVWAAHLVPAICYNFLRYFSPHTVCYILSFIALNVNNTDSSLPAIPNTGMNKQIFSDWNVYHISYRERTTLPDNFRLRSFPRTIFFSGKCLELRLVWVKTDQVELSQMKFVGWKFSFDDWGIVWGGGELSGTHLVYPIRLD